jgi:hypothetical protein
MYKFILVAVLTLTACTDTGRASLAAYGDKGEIVCYSGGQVIYKGRSTGRIHSTQQSDGWEFKDDSTGKFVRVSGDCLIQN